MRNDRKESNEYCFPCGKTVRHTINNKQYKCSKCGVLKIKNYNKYKNFNDDYIPRGSFY
jgi:predicted RNA-binding Zn-ribbon protein involved in translation (DUF1610 family)